MSPVRPAKRTPGRPPGPLGRLRRRVARPLHVLAPAGRAVVLLGTASLVASTYGGMAELRVIGALCLVLLALAVPWLLVPVRVRAHLTTDPPSAVAGDGVRVSLRLTALGRVRVFQPLVRVPAGEDAGWLRFPTLRTGRGDERSFSVRTRRRGVLPVGPAVLHRSDPLGLLRRRTPLCEPVELYVRPPMVPLDSLGSTQVRDLEGVPSDQVSMSDLAFHALREYVRGDDLRHVHWRSSARAGELLVRQYHDSRRTEACLLLDPTPGAWASERAYELGVQVAASVAAAAARTGHDLSFLSGSERVRDLPPQYVLDALCRVQPGNGDLADDLATLRLLVGTVGLVLVVTGDESGAAGLLGRLGTLPAETDVVVLCASPDSESRMATVRGRSVRTVSRLADLPGLLGVR